MIQKKENIMFKNNKLLTQMLLTRIVSGIVSGIMLGMLLNVSFAFAASKKKETYYQIKKVEEQPLAFTEETPEEEQPAELFEHTEKQPLELYCRAQSPMGEEGFFVTPESLREIAQMGEDTTHLEEYYRGVWGGAPEPE